MLYTQRETKMLVCHCESCFPHCPIQFHNRNPKSKACVKIQYRIYRFH